MLFVTTSDKYQVVLNQLYIAMKCAMVSARCHIQNILYKESDQSPLAPLNLSCVVMLNLFVNTTYSFCAQRRDIPKRFAQTAVRRVAARSLLGVHLVAERRHRGHSRGHVDAKPMSVEEARLVVDRDGLGLQKQY